jgi:hypothetical protein
MLSDLPVMADLIGTILRMSCPSVHTKQVTYYFGNPSTWVSVVSTGILDNGCNGPACHRTWPPPRSASRSDRQDELWHEWMLNHKTKQGTNGLPEVRSRPRYKTYLSYPPRSSTVFSCSARIVRLFGSFAVFVQTLASASVV